LTCSNIKKDELAKMRGGRVEEEDSEDGTVLISPILSPALSRDEGDLVRHHPRNVSSASLMEQGLVQDVSVTTDTTHPAATLAVALSLENTSTVEDEQVIAFAVQENQLEQTAPRDVDSENRGAAPAADKLP